MSVNRRTFLTLPATAAATTVVGCQRTDTTTPAKPAPPLAALREAKLDEGLEPAFEFRPLRRKS